MRSAVAKGQYWKQRTKKWLEAQGYVVGFLERMLHVQGANGLIPIKRDQFGADLEAKSIEKTLYVQVKGGDTWRSQLAAARQEFVKYPLSASDEQWIVGWPTRAREPEVEVVRRGPCAPEVWTEPPPARRRPKKLPLFEQPRTELR